MVPVIFEDDSVIVVEKPSGVLVHPTLKHEPDTLIQQLIAHIPVIATAGGDEGRPGIVQRLDKEASGLMVIAKTPAAFENLKRQFQAHTIQKRYTVLVHGKLPRDEGEIRFSIERGKHMGRMAAKPSGQGKEAVTQYLVLTRSLHYTLVSVKTLTGRTHQIRTHFFSYGHPVVGDPLYHSRRWKHDAPRLFLHASLLGFEHPLTKKYVEFKSDLPEELKKYLEEKKMSLNSQFPISNSQ